MVSLVPRRVCLGSLKPRGQVAFRLHLTRPGLAWHQAQCMEVGVLWSPGSRADLGGQSLEESKGLGATHSAAGFSCALLTWAVGGVQSGALVLGYLRTEVKAGWPAFCSAHGT